MRRRAALTTLPLFLAAACGGDSRESDQACTAIEEEGFEDATYLEAVRETPVYRLPNETDDQLCVLRVGQRVMAGCYFESATLAVNSVEVTGDQTHGYAFIYSRDDTGAPIDNFDVPAGSLHDDQAACVFDPPRG